MVSELTELTKGVKDLLGDPKKALLKIAVPMMIAMFILIIYQLVDGFWIAGLGADALSGVGLLFPFFLIIMAIGAGLGTGGSAAISRKLGEKNKKEADFTAIHTIVLGILSGLLITIIFTPVLEIIFSFMTNKEIVILYGVEYGLIIFLGAVIIIFANVANAILRGEGDAKKAMYGLIVGSALNIILDPIFIYYFNMGVSGAAWATILSLAVSSFIFIFWFVISKSTYLTFSFKNFKFKKSILKEILKVGIPASLGQLSISVSLIMLNIVVILAGGTNGVAVFTSGWRVIMIGVIPLLGLSAAIEVVSGAAFGAKDKEKMDIIFYYSIKIGFLIEVAVLLFVFLFAEYLALMFSYAEPNPEIIKQPLITFLRFTSPYYIIIPIGVTAASIFRGIGKGIYSLILIALRVVFLQVLFTYLLGVYFGYGLIGIWLGYIIGTMCSSIISFTWSRYTLYKIFSKNSFSV